MIAESEVVVAREVDDLLAVVGADRALDVFELAQFEEGAHALQFVELRGEVCELRTCGDGRGHGLNTRPFHKYQASSPHSGITPCGTLVCACLICIGTTIPRGSTH